MTKMEFLNQLSEILEVPVEQLSEETNFRAVSPEWSSLTGFALLVFLEDECGCRIDYRDFEEKLQTVGHLLATIKTEKV